MNCIAACPGIFYSLLFLQSGIRQQKVNKGTVSLPQRSLLLVAALSDRYGHYQLIVGSLILLTLSKPLLVYTASFEQLLGLRLLQGAILAVISAWAMANFRDELSSQWLLTAGAFYIGANSLGGIVSCLLGSLMAQYFSWQEAMWALTLLTLLTTLLVLLLLPKPVEGLKQIEFGN